MANILNSDEIIDLEIFISADEKESEEYKKARDFSFYSQAGESAKKDSIALLSFWISKMRKGPFSFGKTSQLLFCIISLLLFIAGLLIGSSIAGAFFNESLTANTVNAAYFAISCILIPLALFISAILFAPKFGSLIDSFVSFIAAKFLRRKSGFAAAYVQNKKWVLLKGALTAQFLGLGIVFGIFFTQLYKQMFNQYFYKIETTMPNFVSDKAIYDAARIISLPWSLFAGEGSGYPSIQQIASSRNLELANNNAKNESSTNDVAADSKKINEENNAQPLNNESPLEIETFEVWARFFLYSAFFYGILLRLFVFFITRYRLTRCFGKHRILNDRKINEIISRMRVATSSVSDWQSLKSNADCENLLLLRSDMIPFVGLIKDTTSSIAGIASFNVFKYDFMSEWFDAQFDKAQVNHKTINIVCFSDDYNEEIFENIESIINAYPEKFVNIILLGRQNIADNRFEEPLAVEKSWWIRKINSVSTRNLKLF